MAYVELPEDCVAYVDAPKEGCALGIIPDNVLVCGALLLRLQSGQPFSTSVSLNLSLSLPAVLKFLLWLLVRAAPTSCPDVAHSAQQVVPQPSSAHMCASSVSSRSVPYVTPTLGR